MNCEHGEPVKWNPYNAVVQCHACGMVFVPQEPLAAADDVSEVRGMLRAMATEGRGRESVDVPPTALLAVLDALAAAAAERDQARAAVDHLRCEHCSLTATAHHESGVLDPERYLKAEAERDQALASLEEHRIAYTAITAERDQARAELDRSRTLSIDYKVRAEGAELWAKQADQRATRLAALEQAARAWAQTDWDTDEGQEACEVLATAVRALDAPPAAAPVAEPCPVCGGELYDRIVYDPQTSRPRCPTCGADVGRPADTKTAAPPDGAPLT